MNERPRWNRPSLMEIVLMISVPIAGLIWFDWSAIQILLLYWCENAILGLFNVLRTPSAPSREFACISG